MSKPQQKSIMRSLGEFVGHVVRGVRADPSAKPGVVRHETVGSVTQTPEGTYTLRRTVIEEVQVQPRADARIAPPPGDPADRAAG